MFSKGNDIYYKKASYNNKNNAVVKGFHDYFRLVLNILRVFYLTHFAICFGSIPEPTCSSPVEVSPGMPIAEYHTNFGYFHFSLNQIGIIYGSSEFTGTTPNHDHSLLFQVFKSNRYLFRFPVIQPLKRS